LVGRPGLELADGSDRGSRLIQRRGVTPHGFNGDCWLLLGEVES